MEFLMKNALFELVELKLAITWDIIHEFVINP